MDEAYDEYMATGVDPTGGELEEELLEEEEPVQRPLNISGKKLGGTEALVSGIGFIALVILGLVLSLI